MYRLNKLRERITHTLTISFTHVTTRETKKNNHIHKVDVTVNDKVSLINYYLADMDANKENIDPNGTFHSE